MKLKWYNYFFSHLSNNFLKRKFIVDLYKSIIISFRIFKNKILPPYKKPNSDIVKNYNYIFIYLFYLNVSFGRFICIF